MPNDMTPCPSCGMRVSQRALTRHRGRKACVERYAANRMRQQHALPEGHRVVSWSAEGPLFLVSRAAGLQPEDSPVRHELIMHGKDSEPRMRLIAPTWLVTIGHVLGHLDQLRQSANRKRKERNIARDAGRKPPAWTQGDDSDAEEAKYALDAVISDAATVLRETSVAAQTGFAVQLSFIYPAEPSRAITDAEVVALCEALRGEASRALGGV